MPGAKYSRQRIAHWTAEGVKRLIGTIDRAGFDAAGQAVSQLHRVMPESFFESLPTKYARQLAYSAIREKLGELEKLRTAPEELTAAQQRKLESYELARVKQYNREPVKEPGLKPGPKPPKGYTTIETYSRDQIENIIRRQDKGQAAGVQVNGKDFTNNSPGAEAQIQELFEKLKKQKKRVRDRNEKKRGSGKAVTQQAPTDQMMKFKILLPIGADAALRTIFIESELTTFDDE